MYIFFIIIRVRESLNSKILKAAENKDPKPKASFNSQRSRKADCPVPGAYNQDGAIYEPAVTTDDKQVESYLGLAKNFKKRFPKHNA